MSNNKQDEPDEYDVIFGSSNSDSDKDSTIEVSDGDTIKPQEYIDAEPGLIDAEPAYVASDREENQDFQTSDARDTSDPEDADIEDGIFAPVRKERNATKKSTSLMWAVSLLALVGVGSFVYVTNPDILTKITQNIDSDDVTVPSDFGVTENVTNDNAPVNETADAPVDANVVDQVSVAPTADQDVIHPNIEQSEEMADPANPSPSASVAVTPTDAPAADMTANVTTDTAVTPSNQVMTPSEGVTPTPLLRNETTVTPNSPVDATASVGTTPPLNEGKQAEMASAPIDKSVETPVVGVVTPPINDGNSAAAPNITTSPDVIAPTNETYEDAAEANAAATATVAAPEPEVVAAEKAAADLAAKQKQEKAATIAAEKSSEKPVIVNSAEEQKRLNDANLNQYFDSPSGNILNMLPAPSMDPKKGSNESIIIVNKKGTKAQKTAISAPPASKHVKIETTKLDSQIVSANRALKLGRYEAAKEMYDELYRLNPRDPQILSGRAVLLQKMGFADQAINAYEELLKLYPDNADAIVNWSGLIRKQYPAVALNKLLDLHIAQPQNALVTAQLGVANADAGNFGDAIRYLNDAAAMEPKNALHFYNLAVISEKAGQRAQAVGYYEKALEVDAIYSDGQNAVPREKIYDRLAQIRGN